MPKIRSNFGVEKCKNRTAADGPHDEREMPACVFRLVNTEVKSTSAFSKNCTSIAVFLRLWCQVLHVFSEKMCLKSCQKQASNFKLKKGQKRAQKDHKMRPKLSPIPTKTDQRFGALSGLVN